MWARFHVLLVRAVWPSPSDDEPASARRYREGVATLGGYASILALLAMAGTSIVGFVSGWPAWASYAVTFFAGFAICAVLAAVGLRTLRNRSGGPRYLEKRVEYCYVIDEQDPTRYRDITRLLVHALEGGVDTIDYRHRWTGEGPVADPVVTTPGCQIAGPLRLGDWRYYYVFLGRELAPGEEKVIHLHQDLEDPQCRTQPFYGRNSQHATDYLSMEVRFSPKRLPLPGTTKALRTTTSQPYCTLDSRNVDMEADGKTLRLVVENPEIGSRYALVWDWPQLVA